MNYRCNQVVMCCSVLVQHGDLAGERRSARIPVCGRTSRLTLFFVIACVLVLSGGASGLSRTETASVDQHYKVSDTIALRQAYLGWQSAQQEAGMDATIWYIIARNGSVKTLSALREKYHAGSLRIPGCNSMDSLDMIQVSLTGVARQFNEETHARMEASSANEEDLAAAVSGATESDARARQLEDEYWMTRMVSEPSSLDRYIRESQGTLTALQEYGYNVAAAQEKLYQITAMRNDFVVALGTHDYGSAKSTWEKIQGASAGFEEQVRDIGVL